MNSIVTSEGAAKTTMCALLAGALLNIALDPVFVYGLDLGGWGRFWRRRHRWFLPVFIWFISGRSFALSRCFLKM